VSTIHISGVNRDYIQAKIDCPVFCYLKCYVIVYVMYLLGQTRVFKVIKLIKFGVKITFMYNSHR